MNGHVLLAPSMRRRLASMAYELLLVTAVLLAASALYTPLKVWANACGWLNQAFQLFLTAVLFAYFGTSWVKQGQTVAMQAWRLKLVTLYGAPLTWRQAGRRYLIALLLFIALPALAYFCASYYHGHTPTAAGTAIVWALLPLVAASIDPEHQPLHDRLAGTRLVVTAARSPR